jgi:hypothetical protein
LEGFKKAITQEIAAIPPKMTRRAMEKYRERLNQCINSEGSLSVSSGEAFSLQPSPAYWASHCTFLVEFSQADIEPK